MNTQTKQELFSSNEQENAGIAVLCRGFLTLFDGKRTALTRNVSKAAPPPSKSSLATNYLPPFPIPMWMSASASIWRKRPLPAN